MFIIMGLLIVMMLGAIAYIAEQIGGLSGGVRATSQAAIQSYVTDCLKTSGTESLKAWALQGGHLALQTPFFPDPPTAYDFDQGTNNLLPLDRIELDIGEDVKNRLDCIKDFKDIRGATVDTIGSPNVKVILGTHDSTFLLTYQFFVNKDDERWEFKDFSTSVKMDSLTLLAAANATVESQRMHEGRIDLDSLLRPTFTFFPLDKTLMAAIEQLNEDFQFFFANRR